MSEPPEDKAPSTPETVVGSRVEKPTSKRVEITRIKPYDRNPRHSVNQEYDRIKVSIRTQGMDQPLVITQRPGQADYMVQAGGNTRLRILQELYKETQDERFLWIDCLYKPWVCESEVMLAHLRENDLRSDLTFIDRARAVLEAKALIEAETGQDDISQRQLEKVLKDRGYSIAHGLISKMGYAVETLLPLIPTALEAGLGRLPVERIRRLERAARAIWLRRGLEEESGFDEVFATLCKRYDSIDWDLEPLRDAIEIEIAEQSEVSLHTIRVELEAQLAGRELVKPPIVEEPEIQPAEQAPHQHQFKVTRQRIRARKKHSRNQTIPRLWNQNQFLVLVDGAKLSRNRQRKREQGRRLTLKQKPIRSLNTQGLVISNPSEPVPGPWRHAWPSATGLATWWCPFQARVLGLCSGMYPTLPWPISWTMTPWARSPCSGGIWPPVRN